MFEAHLYQNLDASMHELKTRDAFKPKPLRRVFIPKGKGETRPLGIPAVRDRIAQEVLRQLLSRIDEPLFHEDSFGFRLGVVSLAKLSSGARQGIGTTLPRLQGSAGCRHSRLLR